MRRIREERDRRVRAAICQPQVVNGPEEPRRIVGRPQPQVDEVEAGARYGSWEGCNNRLAFFVKRCFIIVEVKRPSLAQKFVGKLRFIFLSNVIESMKQDIFYTE